MILKLDIKSSRKNQIFTWDNEERNPNQKNLKYFESDGEKFLKSKIQHLKMESEVGLEGIWKRLRD